MAVHRGARGGGHRLFKGHRRLRDLPEEAPNLEIRNERSAADPGETDLAGTGHLVQCRAGDRELAQGVVHAPRVRPLRGGL